MPDMTESDRWFAENCRRGDVPDADRQQRLQPCGHPETDIVQAGEGTAYCGQCEGAGRQQRFGVAPVAIHVVTPSAIHVIGSAESAPPHIDQADKDRIVAEARASKGSPSTPPTTGVTPVVDPVAMGKRNRDLRIERDELREEVQRLTDTLWSVAGQLAGFTEKYRDPDGRDCKVAVAHLIASDIKKALNV